MKFKPVHENYNVYDLDKSIAFYGKALGMSEKRRINASDGSFTIVYLGVDDSEFLLELTKTSEYDRPYNLGDCEFHLAFKVDDYAAAHRLHSEMGCICYENPKMGIYFITDPDGYWIEIIPARK